MVVFLHFPRLAPPEVSIGPDGGYTNILIKLEDDLCPHNTRACATDTVSRLQVRNISVHCWIIILALHCHSSKSWLLHYITQSVKCWIKVSREVQNYKIHKTLNGFLWSLIAAAWPMIRLSLCWCRTLSANLVIEHINEVTKGLNKTK